MRMRSTSFRVALSAAVSAGAIGAFAAPSLAKTAALRTRGALVLTSFVQNGRTDVERNETLVFKFSVVLKKKSADERSLRITEATGTGTKPSVGARIVKGNIVYFDPTRSQRNYDASKKDNALIIEPDHTSGFTSFQDFAVELPAVPEIHILKSSIGNPLQQSFQGSFRTSGFYKDLVPGAPYFIGDHGNGLLGFDPPRSGATGLVDADAAIIFEFNEPIDINSLDPSTSVTVTRVAINERVPGFIKQDPLEPTGRRFMFVPSVGFGSDKANLQGWDIGVTLGTGITDLAGNPLKRPVTFPVFRTRYVPNAPSCSLVSESFNNQTNMDPATVGLGGEWNTTAKGYLRGGFPTTYTPIDIIYTVASTGITGLVRTRFIEPLVSILASPTTANCAARPNGSRLQQLYFAADLGAAAAITGIGWGPSSNALFAGIYPKLEIDMGHTSQTSLQAAYDANVDVGVPLVTYNNSYTVPQAKNIKPTDPVDASGVTSDPNARGMFDYPALTSPFEWNGVNQVVVDWKCSGGSECQIFRACFVPGGIPFPLRRAFGPDSQGSAAGFTPDGVVYDTRIRKRRRLTYAVSNWYQLASDFPTFAGPLVSPVGQSGGVTIVVEMEGARGKPDPFNPGGFIADPTTGTGFTTNYALIDNHRFFRFRVTMRANLTTNQTANIAAIDFPYCF